MKAVIAVDLGASSGRVMVGYLKEGKVSLEEFHRFKNEQVTNAGHSCWDLDGIYAEIVEGINKVRATGIQVDSLGIDTWGVDFVLLNKAGESLGPFVSYRDTRTEGMLEKLLSDSNLTKSDIYQSTGINSYLSIPYINLKRFLSNDRSGIQTSIRCCLYLIT